MLLSLFGARLFQLQGVDSQAYASRADASGLVNIVLPAKRGRILDRNGVPMAESVAGTMVVADPTRTTPDAEAIAKLLADRLHLDYFDLLGKLTKKNDTTRFVYLARRIPSTLASSVMDELKAHEYVGVDTRPDPLRTYPAGDVAANLIGYLGDDPTKVSGGLERSFNNMLAGKDGKETYEVGGGNRIPLGDNSRGQAGQRQGPAAHHRPRRAVVQPARAAHGGRAGQVPGPVPPSCSTPARARSSRSPTTRRSTPTSRARRPRTDLVSRALSDVYEPGSVEKVLTASSLIDAGKVTPRTRFTVPAGAPGARPRHR